MTDAEQLDLLRLTGSYVALLMFLLPLALAFHEPTTWNWCLDTMCAWAIFAWGVHRRYGARGG
jgi:hypothetical protein